MENNDGTSTYFYSVDEVEGKDLSHWVLGLGENCTVIGADPEPYEVGEDPHSKLYGIKWEVNDDFESGYFSVTVDGVWTDQGTVQFATKAGRHSIINPERITGPMCDDGSGGNPGGEV
jgi:hypothetical protein